MNYFKPADGKPRRKGSFGIALIFMLIAIFGAVLTLSDPPGGFEKDDTPAFETGGAAEIDLQPGAGPGAFTRTLLIAAAVIAVFWAASLWYKRRMERLGGISAVKMEILGRRYISPKHYLLMIRVQGRQFLLGVTDGAVNKISEFDISEELPVEGDATSHKPFARFMDQLRPQKEDGKT